MEDKEKQAKIIFLLEKHEEAISNLYGIFAQQFPSYKDFWTSLTRDELDHAEWLRDLNKEVGKGIVYFDKDRFSIEAISDSINYVNSLIEECKGKKCLLINALSLARDLENAIIEKNYFQIFEGDDPKLKKVFDKLRNATEGHRQRVENALNVLKTSK